MTFLQSLLVAQGISLEEMGTLITMYQHAGSDGVILTEDAQLLAHYNRVFGKRTRMDSFKKNRKALLNARLIVSEAAVYPISQEDDADNSAEYERQLAELIEHYVGKGVQAVKPELGKGKPAKDYMDHHRLAGALVAVDAKEMALRTVKKTLEQPGKKIPVTIGGRMHVVDDLEWDWAYVRKLLNKYGVEHIIDTLFKIYMHRGFSRLNYTPGSVSSKRVALRAYVQKVLDNEATFDGNADSRSALLLD